MTFSSYPNYKDSGVEWLGGIPAHWGLKKFRYVFEESPEKITDEVVGEMLSVSGYRGIEVKQYDDEGRRRTDEELLGYRVVRPGQLVVNTMWLNYAGLGVSDYEGHVSPAYRSYWIDPVIDKRYIHHLMRSGTYVQGYTRLLTGIRPNSLQMGRDDLMVFPVLLPTKSEQTQIARFLDHETARIDALIEEQQRLIELLKEKRQAVISHAVTKGLDPTVPMKDSGVEWLGEVPAHWVMAAVKRYCDVRDGTHSTPEYVERSDFSFPLVTSKDISPDGISLVEASHISADDHHEISRRSGVARGDILMPMIGTIGGAIVVGIDDPFSIKNIALFKKGDFSSSWLAYLLDSDASRTQFELNRSGGVQGFVSLGTLRNLVFPTPRLEEQENIVRFIDQKLIELDQLITEAYTSVDLMLERRSALISAAVTGKIDVRGWQPPASNQTPEPAVAEAH